MKSMEFVIEEHRNCQYARRNDGLRARLKEGKSFEELLAELSSLRGFNVKEREEAVHAFEEGPIREAPGRAA